jgi:NAD+ kinase
MKIILFSRTTSVNRPVLLRQLIDTVENSGLEWCVNEEFARELERMGVCSIPTSKLYGATVGDQPKESILVSVGGDGTLLDGIRRLEGRPIPVLGINLGHLGFLTGAGRDGISHIFDDIRNNRLRIEERSMVRVESDMPTSIQWPFAVNEFAIQRHGANMISVETYVDGQMVATYHGDGVLLSTPTGSTAYSLSVGGPVVAPTCACLVISPLAPHNLTMRPIVIPDSCEVTFRIRARQPYAFVTLDNTAYRVREGTVFKVKKSENNFFWPSRKIYRSTIR